MEADAEGGTLLLSRNVRLAAVLVAGIGALVLLLLVPATTAVLRQASTQFGLAARWVAFVLSVAALVTAVRTRLRERPSCP